MADDKTLFPPVQEYMSWVETLKWGSEMLPDGTYKHNRIPTGEGTLRHHYSLADAKRRLGPLGSKSKRSWRGEPGKFCADWSLYRWDFEAHEWVVAYSGKTGEKRDDNPLFQRRLTKDEQKHPIDDKLEQAAIQSILRAVS
jgi:hypothetical protein